MSFLARLREMPAIKVKKARPSGGKVGKARSSSGGKVKKARSSSGGKVKKARPSGGKPTSVTLTFN